MASRELAESELVGEIAKVKDVAVGVIDVKSYYVETPKDVAQRVRHFMQFAPAQRLAFSTDCGLSQTARWAAREKLKSLVAGVQIVRGELGL
jgi:5-methyltetrahydropteroyltriglutamate--homocysteine methyltransferase